jgi:uncharacterized RDD family membrane protein YckC
MENNSILDNVFTDSEKKYSEYGGFWQRFVAALIDGIIMNIVSYAILIPLGVSTSTAFTIDPDTGDLDTSAFGFMFFLAYVILLVLNVLYFSYQESSEHQATFGKRAMGLVVTDLSGERLTFMNALGRYFARILSAITLGIGYLIQPFTERKQALHDIVAGTLVYKK